MKHLFLLFALFLSAPAMGSDFHLNVGLYDLLPDENSQRVFNGNEVGFIFGIEYGHVAFDTFASLTDNTISGFDIRTGFKHGPFSYWAGLGQISDSVQVFDSEKAWNARLDTLHEKAKFFLLQIDHESGFFARVTRHLFDETAFFYETEIINGKTVVIDSKEVRINENRDLIFIGYQMKF